MKTEKSKKLRGSVLLTVVSVMSLLIIFLSGTLVLASAANNRAHVNYSSAQAGITSRAVADAALKAISDEANPEYASAILSLDSSSAPLKVPVSINSSSTNTGSFGDIQDVTVEYAGKKKYYNEDSKTWEEKDLLKFTSNVTLGGVTSTTTSYVVKDPPQPSGGGGGGAGFVTTGGAYFQSKAYIWGGAYLNLPTLAEARTYNYNNPSTYRSDYEVTLSNPETGIEAESFINGNVEIREAKNMFFPGKGKGITIWGNLKYVNNQMRFLSNLKDDDFDSSNPIDFNDIPYLYVDGEIKMENTDVYIGNKDDPFPLNIFCGSFNSGGAHPYITADIYCLDSDKTSVFGSNSAKSELFEWTSSVVNKVDNTVSSETRGSLYSKGNVKVEGTGDDRGLRVSGNLRVAGDLIINGPLTVGGDLVVGGTITLGEHGSISVGGDVYANADSDIMEALGSVFRDGFSEVENVFVPEEKTVKDGFYEKRNAEYEYERKEEVVVYDWGQQTTVKYFDKFGAEHQQWEIDKYGDTYFVEVDSNESEVGSSAITDEYTYFNNENNKAATWDALDIDYAHYLKVDIDGNKVEPEVRTSDKYTYFDADGYEVSRDDAFISKPVYTPVEPVYPKYAEKNVILGLETVDGHPKEDTQIVKTMEDVLKDVINPYNNAQLPAAMQADYQKLIDDNFPIYTSISDIKSDVGESVERIHDPSTGKVKIITKAGSVGAAIVNKSCIINVADPNGLGNDAANFGTEEIDEEHPPNKKKVMVFDPGSNNIVVVIRGNVGFGSGVDLIIDDSKGGSVYFYLENGATLSCEGPFVTTKYLQLFENDTDFQVYTDPSYARKTGVTEDPPSLSLLGLSNPKVYVYGADGSTMKIANYRIMTANIVSPNIKFKVDSKNNYILDDNNVYYDGMKVDSSSGNFAIGMINSRETDIQIEINAIYVPDNMSTPPATPTPDLSHWFKVLYYDEY